MYSLAYYLSRVEFHCNESLDSNFLATLWLITLDLPAVDLSQYFDMDNKTLALLAGAGVISPISIAQVKEVPSVEVNINLKVVLQTLTSRERLSQGVDGPRVPKLMSLAQEYTKGQFYHFSKTLVLEPK